MSNEQKEVVENSEEWNNNRQPRRVRRYPMIPSLSFPDKEGYATKLTTDVWGRNVAALITTTPSKSSTKSFTAAAAPAAAAAASGTTFRGDERREEDREILDRPVPNYVSFLPTPSLLSSTSFFPRKDELRDCCHRHGHGANVTSIALFTLSDNNSDDNKVSSTTTLTSADSYDRRQNEDQESSQSLLATGHDNGRVCLFLLSSFTSALSSEGIHTNTSYLAGTSLTSIPSTKGNTNSENNNSNTFVVNDDNRINRDSTGGVDFPNVAAFEAAAPTTATPQPSTTATSSSSAAVALNFVPGWCTSTKRHKLRKHQKKFELGLIAVTSCGKIVVLDVTALLEDDLGYNLFDKAGKLSSLSRRSSSGANATGSSIHRNGLLLTPPGDGIDNIVTSTTAGSAAKLSRRRRRRRIRKEEEESSTPLLPRKQSGLSSFSTKTHLSPADSEAGEGALYPPLTAASSAPTSHGASSSAAPTKITTGRAEIERGGGGGGGGGGGEEKEEKKEIKEGSTAVLPLQAIISLCDEIGDSLAAPTALAVSASYRLDAPAYMAVGLSDGTLLVYKDGGDEYEGFGLCRRLVLPGGIQCLEFSDGGRNGVILLAVGLQDGEVALIDATPSGPANRFEKPPSFQPFHFLEYETPNTPVTALAFHRGITGSLLLAVGSGSTIRIMDGATFEVFYAHSVGSGNLVTDIDFVTGVSVGAKSAVADDEKAKILVARDDGIVELIDLETWGPLFGGSLYQRNIIASLSFAGDSKSLAVGCGSQLVVCSSSAWLTERPQVRTRATPLSGTSIETFEIGHCVTHAVYSADSVFLALATTEKHASSSEILLYNAVALERTGRLQCLGRMSTATPATTVAFSPDSRFLLIACRESCKILDVIESPDMRSITATILKGKQLDEKKVRCVAWSPNGNVIAVGCDSMVVLYDARIYEEWHNILLPNRVATAVGFNASSSLLAIGCSNNIIAIAAITEGGKWEIKNEIPHLGEILSLQFSPEPASSFLAAVGGSKYCRIYSTSSYALVQEIESQSQGELRSVSFDPTGTMLVIGGKRGDVSSEHIGGEMIVVRVGELLSVDWFPLFKSHVFGEQVDPSDVCGKLSALSSLERAQLLYHKSGGCGDFDFPLERRLRLALERQREKNQKITRGSAKLNVLPSTVEVISYLREIMTEFPKSVFTTVGDYGGTFEIALERGNPNLLKLVFSVALVPCRAHPYVMMNDELRGGSLTKCLIIACDMYPDVVVQIVNEMVLWPVPSFSAKEVWKVAGGEPVYNVASSPAVEGVFDDHLRSMKGGTLARPMIFPIPGLSSLSFLSALSTKCPAEVFETEEMGIILDELWERQTKCFFFADFALFVFFFVVWSILVTKTNVSASEETFGGERLDRETAILSILAFVFNLLFGYKELRQMRSTSDWYQPEYLLDILMQKMENAKEAVVETGASLYISPIKTAWGILMWTIGQHLEDWWNICDFLTWWMVNLTLIFLVWRNDWTVECAVMTSFLLLLKTLSYLRGFESSGWILKVLYQNYLDSQGFIMVLGTILIGFAVMFRILIGPFDVDYSTYPLVLFTMFDVGIVGTFDRSTLKETQNIYLTMVLFILLMLVVFVVALNGYIAFLEDSYAKVKDHEVANKRQALATLIVDYMKLMNEKQREKVIDDSKYFFALVAVDHEDAIGAEDATRLMLSRKERIVQKKEEARAVAESKETQQVKDQVRAVRNTVDELLARLREFERTDKL